MVAKYVKIWCLCKAILQLKYNWKTREASVTRCNFSCNLSRNGIEAKVKPSSTSSVTCGLRDAIFFATSVAMALRENLQVDCSV